MKYEKHTDVQRFIIISLRNTNTDLDEETSQLWKNEIDMIEQRVEDWYYPSYHNDQSLRPIARDRLYSLFNCTVPIHRIRSGAEIRRWKRRILSGNFPYLRRRSFRSRVLNVDVCIRSAYKRYSELRSHGDRPALFPSRDVFPHGDNDWTGPKIFDFSIFIPFLLKLKNGKNGQKTGIYFIQLDLCSKANISVIFSDFRFYR